jgi:hypothetical protein
VRFAQDNNMVDALASDRSDKSFGEAVLPRRAWGNGGSDLLSLSQGLCDSGFVRRLMHDDEEHIDFLQTQLDLIAKLGAEFYAQHHIGKPDAD